MLSALRPAPTGLTALRRARPALLRWGRTLCTQKAPQKAPAEENLRWWHGSFDPDPIKDTDEEGTASAHAVLVSRGSLAAPVRAAASPPHATPGCLVPASCTTAHLPRCGARPHSPAPVRRTSPWL